MFIQMLTFILNTFGLGFKVNITHEKVMVNLFELKAEVRNKMSIRAGAT